MNRSLRSSADGILDRLGAPAYLIDGALWVFSEQEATSCAIACGFDELTSTWAVSPRPFAMDAFGDLWVIAGSGEVVRVNTEVFDRVHTYPSLDDWAQEVLADTENETGTEILKAWEAVNGRLSAGHRLMPRIPFVLGGTYDLGNLFSVPMGEMMAARRAMAHQLRNMPDGTTVWIDTEDA